jgi:hypothetical protein
MSEHLTCADNTQVGAHDAPIRNVRWVDAQGGLLATGSWDKTVKVVNRGYYFRFETKVF